jgi:hypothetical protein
MQGSASPLISNLNIKIKNSTGRDLMRERLGAIQVKTPSMPVNVKGQR